MKVTKVNLEFPSLEEVAAVLENGMIENFSELTARVVDCPDLQEQPFSLVSKGLSGSTCIADVGGVPYLIPLVKKEKLYNLNVISQQCNRSTGAIIGAGAGPFHIVGVNSEMIANAMITSDSSIIKTRISKLDKNDYSAPPVLEQINSTDFSVLGNFFCSNGDPGKVIEIKASKRTGALNFMSCIRQCLQHHYGDKPVGLGGTFVAEKGIIKTHVMPDFSCKPLNSDEEVDDWLNFYEMKTPFVCVGVLISHDPGLDLRIEHFHGFNAFGEGGHYHCDVTPDEVFYRGYFNVAECLYRIDSPNVTHTIGRDRDN